MKNTKLKFIKENYVAQQVQAILDSSLTRAQFLSALLGEELIARSGSMYRLYGAVIKHFDLDDNHMTFSKAMSGARPGKYIPLKQYVEGNRVILSSRVKKKLFAEGTKAEKCELCDIGNMWNGKPLTLELHHVDGNNDNWELTNLQILCPNCHSQTDNYRSKNGDSP